MASAQGVKNTKKESIVPAKASTNEDAEKALKEKHEAKFQLKLNWEEVEFKIVKSVMKVYRTFIFMIHDCVPESGGPPGHYRNVIIKKDDDNPGIYEVNTWFKVDQVLRDYKKHCEPRYHKDVLDKIDVAIAEGGKTATKVAEKDKPLKESVVEELLTQQSDDGWPAEADDRLRIDMKNVQS